MKQYKYINTSFKMTEIQAGDDEMKVKVFMAPLRNALDVLNKELLRLKDEWEVEKDPLWDECACLREAHSRYWEKVFQAYSNYTVSIRDAVDAWNLTHKDG